MSTTLLGGELLRWSTDVDAWFRAHWFAPAPRPGWMGHGAVVGTIAASGYATLIGVGPELRAVYLAGWVGDANVDPEVVAPYVMQFDRLGYRVSVDEGGLVAEEAEAPIRPQAVVANAMHAAALLAHLGRDLVAISSLTS